MSVAGIDVAHKTVVVAIRKQTKISKPTVVQNTPEGHLSLVKKVAGREGRARLLGGNGPVPPGFGAGHPERGYRHHGR